jgi:hypothetical protein
VKTTSPTTIKIRQRDGVRIDNGVIGGSGIRVGLDVGGGVGLCVAISRVGLGVITASRVG